MSVFPAPSSSPKRPASLGRLRSPLLAILLAFVLAAGGWWVARAQSGVPEAPELPGLLVYTRQADDDVYWDLFRSEGNGSLELQLTDTEDDNSRGEDQPRWSPDGREIAFATFDRDGESARIWRMPFDGSEPSLVAETSAPDAGYPAWRPDGSAILFAGAHEGPGPSTLDLLLAEEGEAARPLRATADVDERSPDWSPDGQRIVYAALDLGPAGETQWWDIYLAEADGGNPQPLVTRPASAERFPRFSPDGSQLIYVSFPSPVGFGRGTLWLRDLASGAERELARNVGLPAAWSPDGEWILIYNTVIAGLELPGEPTAEPPAPSDPQRFGLYAYRVADGSLFRLRGAAGGAQARAGSFKWGQVSDWTAGTATPTIDVSSTPTASRTPSATSTRSITATITPSATASPTPPPSGIYLPIGLRGVEIDG